MSDYQNSKKIKYTKVNKKGEIEEITIQKKERKNEWLSIPPAYFNLGMYLVIPLLLGIFGGRYLDRKFQTGNVLTIILIIFGTISVFYNLIKLYKDDGSAHKY